MSPVAAIRIAHSVLPAARRGPWLGADGHAAAAYPGTPAAMSSEEQPFADLEATLKKAAAALRGADVPFLLGGSLASWARGGPESRHDLDLMIKHEDVERALAALVDAGMRVDDPPEEWLVKAWDGDVLVDLIFCAQGAAGRRRGDRARRGAWPCSRWRCASWRIEDVLVTKLMSLDEHRVRLRGPARRSRGRCASRSTGSTSARRPPSRRSRARSSCSSRGSGSSPNPRRRAALAAGQGGHG